MAANPACDAATSLSSRRWWRDEPRERVATANLDSLDIGANEGIGESEASPKEDKKLKRRVQSGDRVR